jgi:hypothetical protein
VVNCTEIYFEVLKRKWMSSLVFVVTFDLEVPRRFSLSLCTRRAHATMGRLAQLAAVGVKGDVRLWLESANLAAGDSVRGTVLVHVQEEILAKGALCCRCKDDASTRLTKA